MARVVSPDELYHDTWLYKTNTLLKSHLLIYNTWMQKNTKYSKNTQEPLWQELRETIVIYMKKKQTSNNMYICKIIDINKDLNSSTI